MLTPADIKNRTIKTTMGGYNKKDTDEFIASILESFEELDNENKKLKEQLASLSDGIQYYKDLEDNLQKALVLAEKTSDETKNAAKAEAANIVSLAKAEATDIVSKAKNEADEITRNALADIERKVSEEQKKADDLKDKLSDLTSSFEKYKRDIKAIVEDQLEFIESEDYSPETPVSYLPGAEIASAVPDTTDDADQEPEDVTPEDENINAAEPEDNLFKWTIVPDEESDEDEENEEIAIKPVVIEVETESDDIERSDSEPGELADDIEDVSDDDTDTIDEQSISNTVFPAKIPDKNSVSYLSEYSDTDKTDDKNPFTFIDLD